MSKQINQNSITNKDEFEYSKNPKPNDSYNRSIIDNPLVCIVVLNRSPATDVIAQFNNLKEQTYQNFNLIILDDNSPQENEIQELRKIKDNRFTFYSYPPPFKFGNDLKVNYILEKALVQKPKYIYTLHNDMRINNLDLLEKMVQHMESNNTCGAVAPTIYNGEGLITWGPGIVKMRMGKEYILNETYMVRTKCFIEMGLINPKLIYYGTEFYTFNWLRNNNYSTFILDEISVTHFAGGTSNDFKNHSMLFQNYKDYYRARTTILIMKLFSKEETLYRKLRYFYEELYEPRIKMRRNIKRFELFKFTRTLFLLLLGTAAGLLIPIKLNPPLDE